jgi:phosphoglycolate phosphatase
LVVFDWDGTLADSTGRIVYAMQAAAAELGLPERSTWDVKQIIGLGLGEAIAALWPQINPEQISTAKAAYSHHYQDEIAPQVLLYPYAMQLLHALRDENIKLAVATGKSRKGLNAVLDEMGMQTLFCITRCADETCSKPDPTMLNEIIETTGIDRAAVLMVGDTSFDLDMAFNAGVDAVALTHGAHDNARLAKCPQVGSFANLQGFSGWIMEHI